VDDHALFRASLSRLLESESDFDVVAHCASVQEALSVIEQGAIDVVLLDFDLGEENATTFIAQALQLGFGGRILMVTAGMRDSDSVDLLGLGVSGIFAKHNSPALLSEAIVKSHAAKPGWDDDCARRSSEPTGPAPSRGWADGSRAPSPTWGVRRFEQ